MMWEIIFALSFSLLVFPLLTVGRTSIHSKGKIIIIIFSLFAALGSLYATKYYSLWLVLGMFLLVTVLASIVLQNKVYKLEKSELYLKNIEEDMDQVQNSDREDIEMNKSSNSNVYVNSPQSSKEIRQKAVDNQIESLQNEEQHKAIVTEQIQLSSNPLNELVSVEKKNNSDRFDSTFPTDNKDHDQGEDVERENMPDDLLAIFKSRERTVYGQEDIEEHDHDLNSLVEHIGDMDRMYKRDEMNINTEEQLVHKEREFNSMNVQSDVDLISEIEDSIVTVNVENTN
ncbi:hypothetical protein [Bacillus solimangrovi]|uniref:Uncharacterized protein n=1 Tax=Bacillus solimangrovi TaxID=1305675 RepID=A0A1E5LBT1_9BACI|nr:hypothetical protein [Bacillus solimangrovi]OEH91449.1 hypothetical protein BFG57_04865 [Bacillus solimangrovi]